MTDKPIFPPKPGRIELPRALAQPSQPVARRGGFDPALLRHPAPVGPKGPKGRPVPLPGKSRGR